MTTECEGTVLLYSYLHSMFSALATNLYHLNCAIYPLGCLLRPDLQLCCHIKSDTIALDAVALLLPTLSLLL